MAASFSPSRASSFSKLNVQTGIVGFLFQLLFKNVLRFEERSARRCVIAQAFLSNADGIILPGQRAWNRRE